MALISTDIWHVILFSFHRPSRRAFFALESQAFHLAIFKESHAFELFSAIGTLYLREILSVTSFYNNGHILTPPNRIIAYYLVEFVTIYLLFINYLAVLVFETAHIRKLLFIVCAERKSVDVFKQLFTILFVVYRVSAVGYK